MEGRCVRLEPLRPHHAGSLLAAAQAPEIWRDMPSPVHQAAAMAAWIAEAEAAEARGAEFAFAVLHKPSGTYVGSTRFLDVVPAHRGVEVGWTWYTPQVWGTAVNPECKFLLLRHAFEIWGAIRLCLKTDARNARSQAAIRKLGAQYEGTLRQHRIRPDGTYRDTVYFAVLDSEWPEVRAGLQRRLAGTEVGGGGSNTRALDTRAINP